MKRFLLFFVLPVIVFSCKPDIEDTSAIKPKTRMDSISYIIGLDYGQSIKEQEIKANPVLIYKGVTDGLKGENLFPDSIQNRMIGEFQTVLDRKEQKKFEKMLEQNKKEGKAFLEMNKHNEGVTELPNGLQYKIIKLGKGNFPAPDDSVTINYRAMYSDRSTFDMSYDRGPSGIRLNHAIKGLSEGIQLMKPGAIFEFYIPSNLAYGDKNYRDMIPAGSTIIYVVELIGVNR